jgi:hypothetical protein
LRSFGLAARAAANISLASGARCDLSRALPEINCNSNFCLGVPVSGLQPATTLSNSSFASITRHDATSTLELSTPRSVAFLSSISAPTLSPVAARAPPSIARASAFCGCFCSTAFRSMMAERASPLSSEAAARCINSSGFGAQAASATTTASKIIR